MKRILLLSILLISSISGFSQEKGWALGAKIGDPSGLNIRHYLNNDKNAIEVNVGVYGGIWGLRSNYKDGAFDGAGFSFSGVYLWHNEMTTNLKNYYGFGAQFTSRSYYVPDGTGKKEIPTTGLGGLGQVGIEYFLPSSPISIFLEAGAYVELVPSILYFHPQGGGGVRLNF
ncbi:hypothetical protein LV89_02312 [Arcicella aurantiaca]|uniref:Outer membrane protein with beta-barrel domain n=1 Tax=Arcicella aurantiaca TaxID=591202 RepID=A0A316E6X5_9BACT|nr:hypothetical protein [Arcicella aurantiaca]PWK26467.1 hypothetical protein LV89_02312 [Arcicella aurantiaca]